MPTLNLGIVAHVDAGKTTLTEQLLFAAGVSDHLGRVDHGDTVTDADAIERQRGITIRSAVATFTLGDLTVNLIDTPGHGDFIAEVERALMVLDGAILVVSAVEGVQAQTRILIRTLERLEIPFLVFVNKIDRAGAQYREVLAALRDALTADVVALTEPAHLGTRSATVAPRGGPGFVEELGERLAEYDDDVLAQFVDPTCPLSESECLAALARLSRSGQMHPVFFGSALVGVGLCDLMAALGRYLPVGGVSDGEPLHGIVFKIDRDPTGQRVAYVRIHAGVLSARDRVLWHHRSGGGELTTHEARVTSVRTFVRGAQTRLGSAHAGEIATVSGLAEIAIGDQLGRWDDARSGRFFPAPGLRAVVVAAEPVDRPALFEALRQLASQDPLIDARLDGIDHELTVSLYGEVQREVLATRLATEFGVRATFLPTQTVYIERPSGVGRALQVIGTPGNRELATVGLRLDPGPAGSGVVYRREVERGGLLLSFHTAIEETVPVTLQSGLHGWRVTDCVVTLTHSGYWAPISSAGDFRRLTAAVLRTALTRAGTTVCAPVSDVEIEIPAASLHSVLQRLHAFGAMPGPLHTRSARCRITGTMPTDQVQAFVQALPALTQGEGFLLSSPAGYAAVHGPAPERSPAEPQL